MIHHCGKSVMRHVGSKQSNMGLDNSPRGRCGVLPSPAQAVLGMPGRAAGDRLLWRCCGDGGHVWATVST